MKSTLVLGNKIFANEFYCSLSYEKSIGENKPTLQQTFCVPNLNRNLGYVHVTARANQK